MNEIPVEIIEAAKAAQKKWSSEANGVVLTTVFASVQIAQWALESNFGRNMPEASNNPFGIKALHGEATVYCPTHEFLHGRYVKIMQGFAKFASIAEAFDRHAELLATSGYYSKARHARNPRVFANDLTGIYATDPNYGLKLNNIMETYKLEQYDI